MIKSNLPVILLKNLVLLPLGEARIDLNNSLSKKIIELSKSKYDNKILVVTPINHLEEKPDTSDLPNLGVEATIKSKIDLPSGNTRIVLSGIKRVKVLKYSYYKSDNNILISEIISFPATTYNETLEVALTRKLIEVIKKYIKINPYASNSILNKIKDITDLEVLTDITANFMPISADKKLKLMFDSSRVSRCKKLINEINIEIAIIELENRIENEIKHDLDEMQKSMILKEKMKIIKEELGEKDSKRDYIDHINKLINDNNLPSNIINRLKLEISRYELCLDNNPEASVIKSYIDTLISIPFNKFTKENEDLNSVKKSLDKTHYGLIDPKERILEYIAVSEKESPIICLIGPPGVGKTTFAESIASSLNKKFSKISLGGMSDPSELLGHRKAYIGSSPGKIVNALIRCESMNPVILLDEVDKMSKDYKGDPSSVLLDLLDVKQNKNFVDNFIDETIDLSTVTWVLTANDRNEIPRVLQDRLEIIELNSYLNHEKLLIAKNYLIENALNKCNKKCVSFTDEAILKIIENYTRESGVRELDRNINKIIRKVITYNKLHNVEKEVIIDENNIKKYLGSYKYYTKRFNNNIKPGYVKGLAYTPYGGETLEIEVTSYSGKEDFITSGHLGNSLKESIGVSIGYIKSNMDKFGLDKSAFDKTLHINFREGGVPKEGPSAGTVITTAILSFLKNKPVKNTFSSSGEITLLGDVLPVGGLREKCLTAIKNGIKEIYISYDNKNEIEELDVHIKSKLKFIYVNNYIEIYNKLFLN